MNRLALAVALTIASSCGDPKPDPSSPDAGPNNVNATTSTNGTTPNTQTNSGTACGEIGPRFIEAVRGLGRACATDADCKIASRAQVCDCDLAVSADADMASFDSVRAELDAAQCANPFGCSVEQCPYTRLSEPGELIARCGDAGECEVLQIMPCNEYEARAHGGVVPPGGCADNTQCTLRSDLNPCGCDEAISANFPFLTAQVTAEMMQINNQRCNVACMGCNSPGEAVCGEDPMGNMICMAQ